MVDKHVKDSKTGSKHYLPQRRHTGTWLGAPLWPRHPALEWPGPEQKPELRLQPPQELEDRQMEKAEWRTALLVVLIVLNYYDDGKTGKQYPAVWKLWGNFEAIYNLYYIYYIYTIMYCIY